MTITQTIVTTFANFDEMGRFIVDQANRQAKKLGAMYGIDIDECSLYTIERVYIEVSTRPEMQNVKGINRMIQFRSKDFIRELAKTNVEINITSMTKNVSEQFDTGFDSYEHESIIKNVQVNPHEDHLDNEEIQSFLESLPLVERQVIELTAGITNSLDTYQMIDVKKLIDKKARKEKDIHKEVNVWFTTTEVGNILDLSRRQVQHILTKMEEKALDMGLWWE